MLFEDSLHSSGIELIKRISFQNIRIDIATSIEKECPDIYRSYHHSHSAVSFSAIIFLGFMRTRTAPSVLFLLP